MKLVWKRKPKPDPEADVVYLRIPPGFPREEAKTPEEFYREMRRELSL